ncbi:MAG: TldD/PmbA family protein [bacterium]|nr:TldD/PmbA family protein [bacterium]
MQNNRSSESIDEIIEKVKKKIPANARWFDLIEVKGGNTPISFANNRIHSINEKENRGYGVRINLDGKTGFSFTNDVRKIEETVARAVSFAPYGDDENFDLPSAVSGDFEPYDPSVEAFDVDKEIEQGERIIESVVSHFPGINVSFGVNKSIGNTRLVNSNGLDKSYKSSYYVASLSATYLMEDGSKIDVWESKSSVATVEIFEMKDRIIQKIEQALVVKKQESGKLPVLVSPRATARLLDIAVSGLNARSVYKGISPFVGKMGEQFFNEKLSLIDNPLIKESPYSFPFDDEGVQAREKFLIEKGSIANFITDLKHAEKLNIEPLGNASRGYATLPGPSFSNVVVEKGDTAYADILKNIKRGILVEGFIGLGQSNTLTGDFSASLDLAFLIENGKITGRVKDCMISDNLFTLLKEDIVLSSERELHGSSLLPFMFLPGVNYTG